LVDSNEAHVDSWAVAFRGAGHPQEIDDIRQQIGKGGDLQIPSLLPTATEAQRDAIG
jgi:membrane protein